MRSDAFEMFSQQYLKVRPLSFAITCDSMKPRVGKSSRCRNVKKVSMLPCASPRCIQTHGADVAELPDYEYATFLCYFTSHRSFQRLPITDASAWHLYAQLRMIWLGEGE